MEREPALEVVGVALEPVLGEPAVSGFQKETRLWVLQVEKPEELLA